MGQLTSFIVAVLLSVAAHAQSLPAPLRSLVQSGSEVVRSSDLNSEQQKFLWTDTVRDAAGYLRVETTGAYLDLVSDFSKLVERKNVPQEYQILVDKVTVRGFPYIGTLRESTYRTTIVFGRDSQGMLMLTIWKYAKDRARMIMVDEFLNTSVLGCRATLSLSVVPGLDKSLWKTAWLSKDISYELYVTDRLSQSGRPSRSPSAIVALAELMAGVGAGC